MDKNKLNKTSKVNLLKPSMRDNQRYLTYEIISNEGLPRNITNLLIDKIQSLIGIFDFAKAGIIPVNYDSKIKKGIFKINRNFVDHARSCFVMINELDNTQLIIRTLNVSGMVKNANGHMK